MDKVKQIMEFIDELNEKGKELNMHIEVRECTYLIGLILTFCYDDSMVVQYCSKYINFEDSLDEIINSIKEEFFLTLEYAEMADDMSYNKFYGGS